MRYDKESGTVKLVPETLEDLWHVERVIAPGDLVAAKSFRRVKLAEGESGDKREIFVQVAAEKIEFAENANRVRVTGKIVAGGPEEYVQLGSYHTIDVEPMSSVEIKKPEGWMRHELDRLREAQAARGKKGALAIVAMDERQATFATVRGYGVSFDFAIENRASKRDADYSQRQLQYYGDIAKALEGSKAEKIIVAGPGFAKDNLKKFIRDRNGRLLEKLAFETVSTSEQSGVFELLKRGVVDKVAGEERVAREAALMEQVMAEIARESGLAAYGVPEVRNALSFGAVAQLLVLDSLVRRDEEATRLMGEAEKANAEIRVFGSETPGGKQLAGLGGVAALLRFRLR
jgi:protein pelota